ncbi:MAG TPA: hypothetical protein VHW90_05040 [Stellaceae bacterium]|nr:hypothetical protein [Stellaceae bacterium]
MDNPYDRSAEKLGNITGLEHVNFEIPNQGLASDFYLAGLGFTRDPFMFPGTNNMWVNVGRTSQFHLPSGDPLVLRGAVGIVVPDREELLERLQSVKERLKGSKFSFKEHNDYVEARCPWGNEFRLHSPDVDRFGAINLGMPYVEFNVPMGTASGIAKFYREILGAKAKVVTNGSKAAHISVGLKQEFIFRETDAPEVEYDGHHIQVYVEDFGKPHDKLAKHDLITEESDRCQYRFEDIIDLDTGKVLFTIEHEIRSMTHPLYLRPLVNRNPSQTNRTYSLGGDNWNPTLVQSLGMGNRVPDPLKAPKAPTIAKRRAARIAEAAR